MNSIISGSFNDMQQAQQALDLLQQRGIGADEIRLLQVQIPPQLGEPAHSAAVAHEGLQGGAVEGAAKGGMLGLAGGIAAAAIVGPAALLAGAAIGAYSGSLVGTMHRMEDDMDDPDKTVGEALDQQMMRREQVLAVHAVTADAERQVIAVLGECGADHIARSDSTDDDDDPWRSFHPATARPLDETAARPGR